MALTIPHINGIDLDAERPPAALYVASRARIRAGKGVLAIKPSSWVRANGRPLAAQAGRSLYLLETCHATPEAARATARAMLIAEHTIEMRRYEAACAKLKKAGQALGLGT